MVKLLIFLVLVGIVVYLFWWVCWAEPSLDRNVCFIINRPENDWVIDKDGNHDFKYHSINDHIVIKYHCYGHYEFRIRLSDDNQPKESSVVDSPSAVRFVDSFDYVAYDSKYIDGKWFIGGCPKKIIKREIENEVKYLKLKDKGIVIEEEYRKNKLRSEFEKNWCFNNGYADNTYKNMSSYDENFKA